MAWSNYILYCCLYLKNHWSYFSKFDFWWVFLHILKITSISKSLSKLARRVPTLKLFFPYDFDLYTTRSILKYTIMASHKWSAASKGDFPIKSQMDLISLHFEGQMAGCRYFRSKRVVCLTFGRCHTWNGVWALSS